MAQLRFRICAIKPPLTFSQVEMEMRLGHAVEFTQMTLGLVPEVLNAVDVVVLVGEPGGDVVW